MAFIRSPNLQRLKWLALFALAFISILFAISIGVIETPIEDRDIIATQVKYLITINAFLLLIIFILTLKLFQYLRDKTKLSSRLSGRHSQILRHLEAIFNERTGLSIKLIDSMSVTEESTKNKYVEEATNFLRFVTDESRELFSEYTHNDCSVAIKLLIESGDNLKGPFVTTYLRDGKSYKARSKIYIPEKPYPYYDHSPFVDIISFSNNIDYYISNDLRLEYRQGMYKNGNPHWKRFYNSTLIVPIKEPHSASSENIIGFYCVDSLDGKFDSDALVSAAKIVATTVYYVIRSLTVLESQDGSIPAEPKSHSTKEKHP